MIIQPSQLIHQLATKFGSSVLTSTADTEKSVYAALESILDRYLSDICYVSN